MLCERKGSGNHQGKCMQDHIHMLVSILPKYGISEFMGYLIGKSARMIFDRFANMSLPLIRSSVIAGRGLHIDWYPNRPCCAPAGR